MAAIPCFFQYYVCGCAEFIITIVKKLRIIISEEAPRPESASAFRASRRGAHAWLSDIRGALRRVIDVRPRSRRGCAQVQER